MIFDLSLLMFADTRTETRIEWLSAPETWIIAVIIIPLLIAAAAWCYRGDQGKLGLGSRFLLSSLRFAVLLILVLILFKPTLTKERVQTENSTVVVLVDDSFSMGIRDRYEDIQVDQQIRSVAGVEAIAEPSRLEVANGILNGGQSNLIERLREKADIKIMTGSDGVRAITEMSRLSADDPISEITATKVEELELRGRVSRIGDAISDAVDSVRGKKVSAVVLISDGQDSGGVSTPEDVAKRLNLREIPVHVIGVGNSADPRDIRMVDLDLADVVLEGDMVPIDFRVAAEGFEGQEIRAGLKLIREDGGVEQRIDYYVRIGEDGEVVPHRLEFTPKSPGQYLCKIELPYQNGELFKENNALEKPVTVVAQKIKVLYVEGPPRYDYRYLKNSLIRDPTMETHCLLLEADPEFPQESSPGLRPIRSFPRKRETLFEYDVVILGDIRPDALSTQQLEWLTEFVEDQGGGIVFLSGQWFMPRRFLGSPLERLLPVELEDADVRGSGSRDLTESFHVRLTPEGLDHPVMQLTGDSERNEELWQWQGRSDRTMPGFFWYQKVKKLKKGAVALAVHETDEHFTYGPRPIFAFQYQGRGRSFISMTDDTWRLRRLVGNRWFYRFWGQVIRFVGASRLLGPSKRYSVSVDPREAILGSEVNVLARLLGPDFKPTSDEEVELQLERVDPPGGSSLKVSALRNPARQEYYGVTLETRELGEHRIALIDREKEVASATYRVVVPQLEYADPRMDQQRLTRIAEFSGGKYYLAQDASNVADSIEVLEREVPISADREPLWDTRLILALFTLLLTVEWILRKVFRLP
ncbi:MAG: VWA domain-containing protein [Planctomycetia bacterium]|nr:VWA domain-containing protein [Planctomycetia bacterium]MBL6914204.1 VWA domain-containing protein [Planctomycetota bacterium]